MASDRFGWYRAVIADVRDPRKIHRVRVRVPQLLGQGLSAWAEAATYPQRPPRAGQRVYVTFSGGDVSLPVWHAIATTAVAAGTFDTVTAASVITDSLVVNTTAQMAEATITGTSDFQDKAYFHGGLEMYSSIDAYVTITAHGGVYAPAGTSYFENDVGTGGKFTTYGGLEAHGVFDSYGTITAHDGVYAPGGTSFFQNDLGTGGKLTTFGGLDAHGEGHFFGATTFDGQMDLGDRIVLANGCWIKRGGLGGLTLLLGWANFGGGYQNAGYIEYPDQTAGLVGVISGATLGIIASLPAAVRPTAHHVFVAGASGGGTVQIRVESGGNVILQNASPAGPTWVSLSTARWPMNGF